MALSHLFFQVKLHLKTSIDPSVLQSLFHALTNAEIIISLNFWNSIAVTQENSLLPSSLCPVTPWIISSHWPWGFESAFWLKELKLKASKQLGSLLPFTFPSSLGYVCMDKGNCRGGLPGSDSCRICHLSPGACSLCAAAAFDFVQVNWGHVFKSWGF